MGIFLYVNQKPDNQSHLYPETRHFKTKRKSEDELHPLRHNIQ